MIKTVFETEGLLGWTDEFNSFCERILDFVTAEKFYIYTCSQLIQTTLTTNAKAFYRERSFSSLMRVFYFYANLKQIIENKIYGSDLNMASIGEFQQYMRGLYEMMMGRLDAYQFISPHILLVCQKSQYIVDHLCEVDGSSIHVETVVKQLKHSVEQLFEEAMDKVNNQVQNAVNEMGVLVKAEIKKAMAREIQQLVTPEKRIGQINTPNSQSQFGSRSMR